MFGNAIWHQARDNEWAPLWGPSSLRSGALPVMPVANDAIRASAGQQRSAPRSSHSSSGHSRNSRNHYTAWGRQRLPQRRQAPRKGRFAPVPALRVGRRGDKSERYLLHNTLTPLKKRGSRCQVPQYCRFQRNQKLVRTFCYSSLDRERLRRREKARAVRRRGPLQALAEQSLRRQNVHDLQRVRIDDQELIADYDILEAAIFRDDGHDLRR